MGLCLECFKVNIDKDPVSNIINSWLVLSQGRNTNKAHEKRIKVNVHRTKATFSVVTYTFSKEIINLQQNIGTLMS